MLTDQKIQAEAGLPTAYRNGCSYYRNGMVSELTETAEGRFEGVVRGSRKYRITVQLDGTEEVQSYNCTCPALSTYGGACKHIIAVMKAIQTSLKARRLRMMQGAPKQEKALLHPAVSELLKHFDTEAPEPERRDSALINFRPVLCMDPYAYRADLTLEFTIGQKKMYVVKDLLALAEAMLRDVPLSFGASFTLRPGQAAFDPKSEQLMALVLHTYEEEKLLNRQYYGTGLPSFTQKRGLKLSPSRLDKVLGMMGEGPLEIRISGQPAMEVPIIKGPPPLKAEVRKGSSGVEVTVKTVHDGVIHPLIQGGADYYCAGAIFRADRAFKESFEPFYKCMEKCQQSVITVPEAESGRVMESLVPVLRTIADVTVDKKLENAYQRLPLQTEIYLDRSGEGISARIVHVYGERRFCGVTETDLNPEVQENRILLRQHRDERRMLQTFLKADFKPRKELLVQENEEALFDFVTGILPELHDSAQVFCSDEFNTMTVRRPVQVTAGIRFSERGMLEMEFDCPGMTLPELAEVLQAYRRKKRYYRLKDGSFIALGQADLGSAANLFEHLELGDGDLKRQRIELPMYRALYMDSLLQENAGVKAQRSRAFKQLVQDIAQPEDLEYPVPDGILGTLRGYQKTGFRWLKSLAAYGMGGILADDMGLGKTLQVIAFILSEKTADSAPSLVVAPTSLVYNWQEEVRKFAPQLKTAVILGTPEERQAQLESGREADLIITSYGLLKRDIEFYHTHQFQYCIIDEAQHIKNPSTLGAKTVKAIKAKSYFALTGTPIENTLTELWSLFDFLMPGYLHSHAKFKTRYESPIVRSQDSKALRDLNRHIRPFVLRRMKQDVLKELPEKIEGCVVNRMKPEQARLYAAHLAQAQKEFQLVVQEGGFQKGQIKILALLTRLRQLCCHPSLFLEDYKGGSGKLEMLLELLQDAVGSGHRVLLFSQFTGMLRLIQQELVQADLSFFYLDGATRAEERLRMVNAFNGGDKQVFLISLKAGGTGLNLTGADTVIHYDPWWNPAVEDQATDRAYRIGQNKSVQVMRLITQGTIEEKIYALQQKKKSLVDSVIQPGESFLTRMSEADIRQLFEGAGA